MPSLLPPAQHICRTTSSPTQSLIPPHCSICPRPSTWAPPLASHQSPPWPASQPPVPPRPSAHSLTIPAPAALSKPTSAGKHRRTILQQASLTLTWSRHCQSWSETSGLSPAAPGAPSWGHWGHCGGRLGFNTATPRHSRSTQVPPWGTPHPTPGLSPPPTGGPPTHQDQARRGSREGWNGRCVLVFKISVKRFQKLQGFGSPCQRRKLETNNRVKTKQSALKY